MIICPSCSAKNIDNTLFCSECGNYLADDNVDPLTHTVRMKFSELMSSQGNDVDETVTRGTDPLSIHLEIGEVKRCVQISLTKPIHMGRLDPGGSIFPEIDLTDYGGVEKGVSRRHARIMKQNQKIYIEDLGSSNGTFVNGQKLMPYFPELLADGDSLQLGKLQIKVALPNH